MPIDEFHQPSVPKDVETYKEYRYRSLDFIQSKERPDPTVRFVNSPVSGKVDASRSVGSLRVVDVADLELHKVGDRV